MVLLVTQGVVVELASRFRKRWPIHAIPPMGV